MSTWTIGWIVIIGVGLLWELAAILNREKGDTLSEHMWKWFAVKDKRRAGLLGLRRAVLLLLMVWLTAHFVTGGRV